MKPGILELPSQADAPNLKRKLQTNPCVKNDKMISNKIPPKVQ